MVCHARGDAVREAVKILRDVADTLAARVALCPIQYIVSGEEDGVPAKIAHGRFKRDSRAQGVFLKDKRDGFALQNLVPRLRCAAVFFKFESLKQDSLNILPA